MDIMNLHYKAHLSLFATSLLFGANYWIAKGLMPDFFTPFQIVFLRVLFTTLLFWLTALFLPRVKIERKDLLRIFLASMLGIVVNQIMFFEGLRLTRPLETSILHTTTPIVVLLISAWLLKERVTGYKVWGIFLGLTGALIIILSSVQVSYGSGTLLGNTFIVINLVSYSFFLVVIKPVMSKYHPVIVMKWSFLFALLVCLPLTGHTIQGIEWQRITPFIWFSLSFVIIGTTYLAYLLVTYSLGSLSPAIVGYYMYLQPSVAATIGILFYDDYLTTAKILATLLVFAGIYLINKEKSRLIKTSA